MYVIRAGFQVFPLKVKVGPMIALIKHRSEAGCAMIRIKLGHVSPAGESFLAH